MYYCNQLNYRAELKFDDLTYWNVRKSVNDNEIENLYDDESSLALSM